VLNRSLQNKDESRVKDLPDDELHPPDNEVSKGGCQRFDYAIDSKRIGWLAERFFRSGTSESGTIVVSEVKV
jgi:hypothetical protein